MLNLLKLYWKASECQNDVLHPANRALTRKKGSCRHRVNSLLSMRNPLLGDSFKPRSILDRTPRCHIDFRTEGSILAFALSKI